MEWLRRLEGSLKLLFLKLFHANHLVYPLYYRGEVLVLGCPGAPQSRLWLPVVSIQSHEAV